MNPFTLLAKMLLGGSPPPQSFYSYAHSPDARQSQNVQDVTMFPPKPNIRSGGMLNMGLPHYYDPAKGGYVDPVPDVFTALIRAGLAARNDQEIKPGDMDLDALSESFASALRPVQPGGGGGRGR